MFILRIKLNKKKAIISMGIILAVSLLIWYLATSGKVMLHKGETLKDRTAYLSFLGYEMVDNYEYESEITIPEDFSQAYKEYNNKQIEAGYDLSSYKNFKAKMFSYKLKNSGMGENVFATIIVYNGNIIGGDISSMEGNFILPLVSKSNNLISLKES